MAENFECTYSAVQQEEIENIRKKYLPKELSKEEDKMETLRRLDKKAQNPISVTAIIVGILGSLVFGIGMCCTMVWAEKLFEIGIIVGILGMIITASAYPIYKKAAAKKRAKLAEQILQLTSELAV